MFNRINHLLVGLRTDEDGTRMRVVAESGNEGAPLPGIERRLGGGARWPAS